MTHHALSCLAAFVVTSGIAQAQVEVQVQVQVPIGYFDLADFSLLPARSWNLQPGLKLAPVASLAGLASFATAGFATDNGFTTVQFSARPLVLNSIAQNSLGTLSTAQITRSYYTTGNALVSFGVQINSIANNATFAARNALVPVYALTASVARPFATPLGAVALNSGLSVGTSRATALNAARTVWQGGVDAALQFSAKSSVGLGYSVESALAPGAAPQRNLSASYGYQPTPSVKLLVNLSRDVSKGWAEPALGLSAGVSLRYSY